MLNRSTSLSAMVLLLAVPLGLLSSSDGAKATPTQPGDLQQPLSPSDACSTCHDFFTPADLMAMGGSIEPWAWSGSMMGNSARDPVFWAAVALAEQDHPDETGDCVRCHAPRAFLDGLGDALSLDELTTDQRAGVECDFCHRMLDDSDVLVPGNAQFTLADAPVGENVPRFGPWAYEALGPEPQHPWAQDLEYLPSSSMCGTCHDVTTGRERVDDRGVGLGVPFNEQRTYSEWLGSAYAQPGPDQRSCQDCHMPAIEFPSLGCNMFAGAPHESGGRRHVLVGANAGTLRMLKSLYGDAGTGEVPDWRFDESIAWTEEFVQTAATLEVEFPAQVDLAEGLPALPVTVTNNTGHKLPSGYSEGRVMWIEVSATYLGEPVWSSGLWDAQTGVIEADPQVRRYEAIAERFADGTTFHLLLNDHWVIDNRIPPKGLVQDLETDPVSDRYVLQDDQTWPHWDSTSYGFPPTDVVDATPGEPDELELRVRLLYWVNTSEYLDTLVSDNQLNDAGQAVVDAFAGVGGSQPIVLGEAVASVPLTGLSSDEGGDTTDEAGTDTDSESDTGTGEGEDEVGETDGGPAGDDEGGCACSTESKPPHAWGALVLLSLLGVRRRARERIGRQAS